MIFVSGMISVTIITIFILNLSHDDGTSSGRVTGLAAVELKMFDSRQQFIEVDFSSLLVGSEGASEEHGMIVEEPGW